MAICSTVYIFFNMIVSVFADNIYISFLLLVLFSLVLTLTTLRRLHDAKLNKNWLLAPTLTFVLIAMIIIISEQSNSYYLLLIPALCSAVLLTYSSNTTLHYTLGYYGPIEMSEYQSETDQRKQSKFRIEPTLVSDSTVNFDNNNESTLQAYDISQKRDTQNQASFNKQADIGEMIRMKLLSNNKVLLILSAAVGLTLIGFSTSWLINYLNRSNETLSEVNPSHQIENTNPLLSKSHPLFMPDNYTLYLSEYRGISINWQADEVKDTILWSTTTAQGDESCKEISFNTGEPIRTLLVQVENSTANSISNKNNYYAYFSPLDSKALIQALAFRSNFTLCGYNFSLKGSQAVLEGNEQYAQWVGH